MKKTGLYIVIVAVCMGIFGVGHMSAVAKEKTVCSDASGKCVTTVTVGFGDGVSGETVNYGAEYTDAYFSQNAKKEQKQLAVLSMLASATCYDGAQAEDLMEQCGFSGKYTENAVTKDDNDYVSYIIGHKKLDGYTVVAVWIRGTGGNYEWVSNFNLGTKATHAGFSKAEQRLFNAVTKYIKKNKIGSKAKFWITGHSRGAAVGNLLAKRMTDRYGAKNVFAYTFATPRVSVKASEKCEKKYKNIRNYINPADFVTDVPPCEWGYNRYGEDIVMTGAEEEAMKKGFQAMTGTEYLGFSVEEKAELTKAFLDFCGEGTEDYYTAKENGLTPADFCMKGLACNLAGDKSAYLYLLTAAATDESASKILELMGGGDSADKFGHAHCLPTYLSWLAAGSL